MKTGEKGKKTKKKKKNKKKKAKADEQFYKQLVSGTSLENLANQYTYQYTDGYKADKDQLIQDHLSQLNQQSGNSFTQYNVNDELSMNILHQFAPIEQKVDPSNVKVGTVQSSGSGQLNNPSSNNLNLQSTAKCFVSGVFGGFVAPMHLEEQSVQANFQPQEKITKIENSCITTFNNEQKGNQLSDLQLLLQNSKAIAKAKQLAGNGKFTDPDFPADVKSIIGFGEGNFTQSQFSQFPWLRATDYFKGKFSVFDVMEPSDIEQGGLGDCYFLAAISALAEYDERASRLFLTKNPSADSIYVMAMCDSGIWSEVVLDDLTPCQKVSKKPIFNRSSTDELWVILLEKAWAKIHGGFQNIVGGLAREALRSLTGASCKTFFTQENREQLWKQLLVADKMSFIMTTSTDDFNNGSDAYNEKVGICGSHAYSLLAVHELHCVNGVWKKISANEKPQGTVERVLQIRNPWGKGEWKGSWSDLDKRWNSQLRTDLNQENNQDDGKFCISWSDYVQYYSDLQICYYYDNYSYSAIKLTSEKNATINLSFEVKKEGVFYLSLNQKLRRSFPKNKNYNFSPLSFSVALINNQNKPQEIGTQTLPDFENWIEKNLKPGKYVVTIKTPWVSFVNEFSFSIYGPEMCPITNMAKEAVSPGFLQQSRDQSAKADTVSPKYDFAKLGYPDIFYKFSYDSKGYGFLFVQNDSKDTTITLTPDFTQSTNLELKEPHTGLKPSLTVVPGKKVTVNFEPKAFPCTIQMRIMASFEKVSSQNNFIEEVRKSSIINRRRDFYGKDRDVVSYYLSHASGIGILYVNNEPNSYFQEEVVFQLDNCVIEGDNDNKLEVLLKPKSEKLVKIVVVNPSRPFNAYIKTMMSWFS